MLRKSFTFRAAENLSNVKGLIVTKSKNTIDASAPGIVTITLNRPKQKNSITRDMYIGIGEAFASCSKDPEVGAVVLTGAKECNMYCSGNDLKNLVAFGSPRALSAQAKEMCFDFVQSFVEAEKPIVAGVSGPAIGIAVTTLSLCDYRYCTKESTFNTPFRALAQAPEGCSSYLFPEQMGKEMAKKMLVDGYTMSSEEAVKHNFMHEVLPDKAALAAKCEQTAMELACGKLKLKDGERYALKNKDLLRHVNREEVEILEEAWVSKECFNAIIDFMEKKGNKKAAWAMRAVNATRFLWDHK